VIFPERCGGAVFLNMFEPFIEQLPDGSTSLLFASSSAAAFFGDFGDKSGKRAVGTSRPASECPRHLDR